MSFHCSGAMILAKTPLLNHKSRILISNSKRYIVFGIDLGTTCSRVAIVKRKKNDPDNFEAKVVADIPSVISFLKDGKCIVGWAAKKRLGTLNTFYATNRLIGRRFDDPITQEIMKHVGYKIVSSPNGQPCLQSSNIDRTMTPAQLEASILLKLKDISAEKSDEPMKNVVLSVPAYFNADQIQSTKEAGRLAGLNVLDVISTPSAAILAYPRPREHFDESKTVVVYNFGGTTFNVSVLKIYKHGSFPEVLSTVEDLFLGGQDFDKVLVDHLASELKRMTKFDITLDKASMQWLRISAENAKINLTTSTEVDLSFWGTCLPRFQSDQRKLVERIGIKLTRSKFEELVGELIHKTTTLCQKALEEAKIPLSDIDEVLAIGGTSKIPKVRETVREIFNKEPVQSECTYREEAVAIGAALRGYALKYQIPKNDGSHSFDVSINVPKPVIESEKFHFRAIIDDPVDISVFEGSNRIESDLMAILPDEEAHDFILKQPEFIENCKVNEDLAYVMAQMAFTLYTEYRCMETPPPKAIKETFEFCQQQKDKVVEAELDRILCAKKSAIINSSDR